MTLRERFTSISHSRPCCSEGAVSGHAPGRRHPSTTQPGSNEPHSHTASPLIVSTSQMVSAKEPQDEENDQHQHDNPAETSSTVASVTIVTATTAEQQHNQYYQENQAHVPPLLSIP